MIIQMEIVGDNYKHPEVITAVNRSGKKGDLYRVLSAHLKTPKEKEEAARKLRGFGIQVEPYYQVRSK